MAWLDDRAWCHPKLVDVSKQARWTWTAAICYASGFQTRGRLTAGQLAALGCTRREQVELVEAGLWQEVSDGGVEIHDWDDHNSSRDERRAKDRERKRRQRERDSSPECHADVTRDTTVTEAMTSRVTACVEGSEGSEGDQGQEQDPLRGDADASDTTQTLLAEIVDQARERGSPLPRKVVGQTARQVKTLLDEGHTPAAIRAGWARMLERGLVQPSLLPNFVAEAALPKRATPPASLRFGRGVTGAMTAADVERLEAREARSQLRGGENAPS